MARPSTPIPPNEIGENFAWRDWFQKLSNKVFGSMSAQDSNVVSITGGNIDGTPIGVTTASTGHFTTLSLDTALGAIYGGTGQSSVATGNLLYGSAANTWSKLAIGSTGQVLRVISGIPAWGTDYVGTVTSVTGTAPVVSSGGTTPVISMAAATSSVNGYLTSTDWSTFNNKQSVAAPVTKTADFTVAATDLWLINNKSGSTCTVTLPTASSYSGRILFFQNYQVQTVVSATSNVVAITGGAAGTSILLASSGDQCTLVSDGTSWLMTQYMSNNNLLLE